MQIRQSVFETNSSSTHSICISDRCGMYDTIKLNEENNVVVGEGGETEFGWEQNQHFNVNSKLNYAWMLAEYSSNRQERIDMVKEVVQEQTKANNVYSIIDCNYEDKEDSTYGYIDHQSTPPEGRGDEIFKSKQALKDFIFNPWSYIETDNDNH